MRFKIDKKPYSPELSEFIDQCELNYFLLTKLIPQLDISKRDIKESCSLDAIRFRLASDQQVIFQVTAASVYTTSLSVHIKGGLISSSDSIEFAIRVYHDAQLAEVMEGASANALKAIKALMTKTQMQDKGRQIDEKRQLNRFLGECINFCLNKDRRKSE